MVKPLAKLLAAACLVGGIPAGSVARAADVPTLRAWLTQRTANPTFRGRDLPLLWRLALADDATGEPFDVTLLHEAKTLAFARAGDVAYSQRLNPRIAGQSVAEKVAALTAYGRADFLIQVPKASWATAPWQLAYPGGQHSCAPQAGKAPVTPTLAGFLTRLGPCLGYSAVITDVNGEYALGVSLRPALIRGLQGLLIKNSAKRPVVPAAARIGDGQMKILDFDGPFVLLKRQVDSPSPLEVGAKVDFENIELPKN